MKFNTFITVVSLPLSLNLSAQSYTGFTTSNWSGVARADVNPASIAEHLYRWDFTLTGASTYASNSLVYWDQRGTRFTFRDDRIGFASAAKHMHGFTNIDILLPRIMVSPNRNYTLSMGMRLRGVSSLHKATPGISQSLELLSKRDPLFMASLAQQSVAGGFHVWKEIHFTYARVVKRKESNSFKLGLTPKLLLGMHATHFRASSGDFIFTGKEIKLTGINATLNQAGHWREEGANTPYGLRTKGMGVGLDIGFEMEHNQWNYRRHYTTGRFSPAVCSGPNYLYRLGVAFLDIGTINYQNGTGYRTPEKGSVTLKTESVPNIMSPEHVRDSAVFEVNRVPHSPSFRMVLPARAVFDFDYNLGHGFYINSLMLVNLSNDFLGENRSEMPHQLTLTARWETSTVGVYAPLSVNQYGQTDCGLALRAGPVIVGVHNMGALLWEAEPTQIGVFVTLKAFQFCKKKRIRCPRI